MSFDFYTLAPCFQLVSMLESITANEWYCEWRSILVRTANFEDGPKNPLRAHR